MKDLRIVFINHQRLDKKLRSLRCKEELHARLDKMHSSLQHSLEYSKQQQMAGTMEEAQIFQMEKAGFHPHLLVSDPIK